MLRRNRKRAREDAAADATTPRDDDGDDGLFELFDDTLSALQLLMERSRGGFAALSLPPVVLRHQLYTVLSNRTFVDQNLNKLRQNGTIVTFRIPTGTSEGAVVLFTDYAALASKLELDLGVTFDGSSEKNQERVQALATFRLALPAVAKLPIITLGALGQLFEENAPSVSSEEDVQRSIGLIQKMGFLMATTNLEDHAYQLSLPGIGQVVTAVKKTRASIRQALQRTKYKETFEHQLKKLKLRHSKLDWDYHLAEMEGAGLIRRTKVTSGTLVALPN